MGLYISNISKKIVSMSDLGYTCLTDKDRQEFEPYTPVKIETPDVLKETIEPIQTPIVERKKRGRNAKV